MNRSRQSIFDKLRKSMSKAIKSTRNTFLSKEAIKDRDLLTAKELSKKFPKKTSRKKEELAKAIKRKESGASRTKKTPLSSKKSKRTTPGTVNAQSSPGYAHREGARWIKNSNKKIKDQRIVAAHHGGVKK